MFLFVQYVLDNQFVGQYDIKQLYLILIKMINKSYSLIETETS